MLLVSPVSLSSVSPARLNMALSRLIGMDRTHHLFQKKKKNKANSEKICRIPLKF